LAFTNIPRDLTAVRSKILFGLNKRQLICFSLAAAVGVPTYLLSRLSIGNDFAVILMIALMLPFFFFAMFEKDNQPAEKILRNIVRVKLWPGKRPYKTENLYDYLSRGGSAIAENSKTARKTPNGKRPTGKR